MPEKKEKQEEEFKELPRSEVRPLVTPLSSESDEFETVDTHPFQIVYSDKRGAQQISGKIIPVKAPLKGGSGFKFLKLSPDFLLSGVLEASATVTAVAGNAGETTLNTYTVPLNSISRNDTRTENVGNVFRVHAAGRYTTDDATATVALKLKVGSTTYHTLTSTGATVTNAPWRVTWTIMISAIGTSGTAESFAEAAINNVNKDSPSTATQAIDTTVAQAISLTATWTSGDAADGISIRQFLIELLN